MLTPEQLIDIAEQCFDEPLKSEIANEKNKSYAGFNKKGVLSIVDKKVAKLGIIDKEIHANYNRLMTIIFHGKTFEIQTINFCRFDTAKAVDMIRNFHTLNKQNDGPSK